MNHKIYIDKENYITYRNFEGNLNNTFDILYLNGFGANMDGIKSIFIENICKENNIGLIKVNLLGHGDASGRLIDFTMSDWLENIRTVINKFSKKDLIIIGASLGGWLAFLIASEFKEKIKGIIAIAPAIDCFTDIVEPLLTKEDLNRDIIFEIKDSKDGTDPIPISKKLLIDSKKYNLFPLDKIDINCSIKLIHGMQDAIIPYRTSLKLAEKLLSTKVEITLIKEAKHKVSEGNQLNIIKDRIMSLIKEI